MVALTVPPVIAAFTLGVPVMVAAIGVSPVVIWTGLATSTLQAPLCVTGNVAPAAGSTGQTVPGASCTDGVPAMVALTFQAPLCTAFMAPVTVARTAQGGFRRALVVPPSPADPAPLAAPAPTDTRRRPSAGGISAAPPP